MNKSESKPGAWVAAVALAGLALAGPVLAGPQTANYDFDTIDFPGASSTDLLGFTTRTLVGDFADAEGNSHGWLLSADRGEFRQFDVPDAWFTSCSAINRSGDFGGVYRDDPEHPARRHGFLVVKDVLTTIDYPGSTRTSIVQMNDRGQVAGIGRIPSEGATTPYGFVWKDGVFTDVSFPGAFGTGLDGINQQGDVCGFTTDEAGGLTHAMMRVNGVFSHIEPPGSLDSLALSINDRGQVAGPVLDDVVDERRRPPLDHRLHPLHRRGRGERVDDLAVGAVRGQVELDGDVQPDRRLGDDVVEAGAAVLAATRRERRVVARRVEDAGVVGHHPVAAVRLGPGHRRLGPQLSVDLHRVGRVLGRVVVEPDHRAAAVFRRHSDLRVAIGEYDRY